MSSNGFKSPCIGIVSDLDDPDRLGRVKVTYPNLNDVPSDWARLVTLMAGPDRGSRFVPEPGDEVLVAFEQGDPRYPYILGSLWSQVDPPPADDGDATGNHWAYIKDRSGGIFRMDSKPGRERIEIIDKDGERSVVIDSANQKIQIVCEQGDIEVTAKNGSVTVEATTIEIKASGNMTLEAQGTMTISGATVNIN